MRSQPFYYCFWLPLITLCGFVTRSFIVMWANAPSVPSQGMEGLIMLPYGMASLLMAPFILFFGLLLWLRPRKCALRLSYTIPTTAVTLFLVIVFFVYPRPSEASQEIELKFVDSQGNMVTDLNFLIYHSSAGFDLTKGRKTRREGSHSINGDIVTVTKTRGEETEIRIEKEGFYHTRLRIPNVGLSAKNSGLQKIDFAWMKDWGRQSRDDSCHNSLNWPADTTEPLKVPMLRLSEPSDSPLPKYTEENIQELMLNNS